MDGQLEQVAGRWQIKFVRELPHPPEKVWRALTEPKHLAAWFPNDIEGERVAGAPLRFVFRHGEAPDFEGKMITFDPPSLLEFTWGEDVLRFELRAEGRSTVLTFTDTIEELGKAARDTAGWHECLDLLEYDLNGEPAPFSWGGRWADVHPGYVEEFGPEASTIGPPEGFSPPDE
jgi:uncharacterized protein YndB with AHSA1/START domain